MPTANTAIPSLSEEVHVWLAEPTKCHRPELIATYLSWLDAEERSRYERFRFPHHRHEYLVAHALLRSSLSNYGNCLPEDWRFSKNAYGRPEIQPGCGQPLLRFNLSHTEGLVACAITQSATVGIDVERITRLGDLRAIAEVSFAPEELTVLSQLPDYDGRQYFFRLWTLKEAYVKAQGKGLSMPLQQIAFRFSRQATESIHFAISAATEPLQNWQFAWCNPTPEHSLALAICLDQSLHLETRWAIPGVDCQLASVVYVHS
jgi:4'-phosphopantetheinyl transferase